MFLLKIWLDWLSILSTNFETLIVCLKQITASKDFMLTINVLREASLILSIISELCNYGAVDSFKRVHEGLYDNFIRESKALVVRLSIFLGASASSREIFRAMADFESTDGTHWASDKQKGALHGWMWSILRDITRARA